MNGNFPHFDTTGRSFSHPDFLEKTSWNNRFNDLYKGPRWDHYVPPKITDTTRTLLLTLDGKRMTSGPNIGVFYIY